VRLGYRSEAGSEWDTEVDPWALVVRHGRWYLLCHSHSADALRAYRIDRVRGVEVLTDTFTAPTDLDPVGLLEEHLAVGWEYDVDVLIEAPLAAVAARLPRALGRLERVDDTTTRLVASTGNPWWYAERLASISSPYRIVGGPELQETARVVGQRLLTAAGDATADEPGA
jgi:predicted DNA-binding transcriptional regulator YafY